ncbi:MAG: hypothetical protein KBC73_04650 [Burkholderiaceae bacterium]|nr:hypothetical protein [Burkholderiaceae bacterium]
MTQHPTDPASSLRRQLLLAGLATPWLALPAGPAHADSADEPAHTLPHRGWTATRGGQGGRLIRVTTLAPSGPGSLREALETPGPRTVVFEVGGVIDMAGAPLAIRHPHISIAGQTAPSPGISILKSEFTIGTHDVLIQHLRFRPGEFGRPKKGGGDQDGISTLGGAHDVIVDHCSFSWATDENLSASGPRFDGATPDDWRRATSHRITYSHNLIAQSLSHSVHEKGEHSKGSLIHDNTSAVLLWRNAYLSNRERNALFKGGARGAMVNNWIANPGRRAVHYNLLANEWEQRPPQLGRVSLVGNVYRAGPDTEAGTALFTLRGVGDVELHLADNLAQDRQGRPLPLTADQSGGAARIQPLAQADLPAGLPLWTAAQTLQRLPACVGARPWDRDAIDAGFIEQLLRGEGRIIDSELEHPLGYPAAVLTRRPFREADWDLEALAPRGGWAAIRGLTRPA